MKIHHQLRGEQKAAKLAAKIHERQDIP